MDTSEQYIKMCDCPEIQGEWKIGMDAMAHPATDSHDYAETVFRKHPKYKSQQEVVTIWLPRQDQIQEMMIKDYANNLDMLVAFYGCGTITQPMGFQKMFNASMEQLWLAFYFHEKHSKIWSSKEEKWVKK